VNQFNQINQGSDIFINGNTSVVYGISRDNLGTITHIKTGSSATDEYSFDAFGRRRSAADWSYTLDSNDKALFADRGFTGHEHLTEFGLINMNGRLYDPLVGRFLSPDNYVQSPDFTQSFNWYNYCLNNPLRYTDPSGDFIPIWVIPNIGWSKAGGLSLGISVVAGVPGGVSAQIGGGYSFKSGEAYGYAGVTYAFNTGYLSYSSGSKWSVGYTAGASIFSGLPVSTNFAMVGVNYNISYNSWSGNVSAWSVDQSGWSFNPSVSVMVCPEQTTNFVRGQGFRSNDAVLSRFVAAGNQQGALDYWGFNGTYDPSNKLFRGGNEPGAVDPYGNGDVYYNTTAFNGGFDKLYFVADHEGRHSSDVRSGKYNNIKLTDKVMAGEEFNTWAYNYKRQGLYTDHGYDIGCRLNSYGTAASINPDIIFSYSFYKPWWHVIYRIPRKW
jgi:RHS repeat-associated protein